MGSAPELMSMPSTNWAGNYTYRARQVVRPRSVDEVVDLVRASRRVRALGSRHSFTALPDSEGTLLDLSQLPPDIEVDAHAGAVWVGGGVRYGDLATELEARGWALASLASLPHICVAGAVATGTHGSGDGNQSLAGAVRTLEIVGPDGRSRLVHRGDPDFDGSVVSLGALGIVTRLELDIEPSYQVRQEARTGLGWATLYGRFDEVTGAGYSVSLFTRFDEDAVAQMWVKSRADRPTSADDFGTLPTGATLHMLPGGSPEAVTTQGGVPGAWLDRLPHFRMAFTPSNGAELQSEYYVDRRHALAGIDALRGIATTFAPLIQVAEIRTIAADDLWLSGAQGRDTVAFHFTWVRDEPAVRAAVRVIEAALAPLGARPHWGKVFEMDADALADVFPHLADFADLRRRVDPDHVFGNDVVDRILGEAAADVAR
jgi:xylitol oxidase